MELTVDVRWAHWFGCSLAELKIAACVLISLLFIIQVYIGEEEEELQTTAALI